MPDPSLVPPDGQLLQETIARARRRLTQEPGKFVSGADRRLMTELADALDAALSALHEAEQRAKTLEDRNARQALTIHEKTEAWRREWENGKALEASLSEARQERDRLKERLEKIMRDGAF